MSILKENYRRHRKRQRFYENISTKEFVLIYRTNKSDGD